MIVCVFEVLFVVVFVFVLCVMVIVWVVVVWVVCDCDFDGVVVCIYGVGLVGLFVVVIVVE